MLRIYRLTSAQTVTTVGQATTTVIARGRIKLITAELAGVGGAALGRLSTELAINNTANGNAETVAGAPSAQLSARIGAMFGINGASNVALAVPVDIPLNQGDQLCINLLGTGTAPASAMTYYDVYVMEGGR